MKKTVWTFGLISGGILGALMLVSLPFADSFYGTRAEVVGYATMVLAFLLVFFGVRSYRDNVSGGSIGFGRALAVGSLIVLVATACYVATWEVIYYGLSPDIAAKFEKAAIEHARAGGGTQQEIQKKVADAQKFARLYRNPAFNAAVTFLEPLPVGLVFALLSAAVLGRRRRGARAELAASLG